MPKLQIKILVPLLILLVSGLFGANLWLSKKIENPQNIQVAGLRQLTLKAPGMFCLGCSASVEGYVGAVSGVKNVRASLGTKRVEIVYDPSVVSKEAILGNQVFTAYGKEFISDEAFSSTSLEKTPSTTSLPQTLSQKLQKAAFLVQRLDNPEQYQATFDAIDQAIAKEDFAKAEKLVDQLLVELAQ